VKNRLKKNTSELEQLFKGHYALLCLVSLKIVKDRDVAKDVVQDFFISYWQRIDDISLKASFKSYSIRAVKNLSLQSLEKERKKKAALEDFMIIETEEDTHQTPIKTKKLQELLNRLPEKRRTIFMSVVVHGQSYKEIAENNGVSVNTVKTQMKRAYSFLRSEANKDLLYFIVLTFFIFI